MHSEHPIRCHLCLRNSIGKNSSWKPINPFKTDVIKKFHSKSKPNGRSVLEQKQKIPPFTGRFHLFHWNHLKNEMDDCYTRFHCLASRQKRRKSDLICSLFLDATGERAADAESRRPLSSGRPADSTAVNDPRRHACFQRSAKDIQRQNVVAKFKSISGKLFNFFFLKIKQSRDWANEYLYSTKFLRVQISCTIITNANQVKWPILPHLESGSFAYDLGPLESARYPQSNVGRLIKHSADFFLQIIIAHLHTTLSMNLNSFGENLYIVVRWSNKTQTFSRNDPPE